MESAEKCPLVQQTRNLEGAPSRTEPTGTKTRTDYVVGSDSEHVTPKRLAYSTTTLAMSTIQDLISIAHAGVGPQGFNGHLLGVGLRFISATAFYAFPLGSNLPLHCAFCIGIRNGCVYTKCFLVSKIT